MEVKHDDDSLEISENEKWSTLIENEAASICNMCTKYKAYNYCLDCSVNEVRCYVCEYSCDSIRLYNIHYRKNHLSNLVRLYDEDPFVWNQYHSKNVRCKIIMADGRLLDLYCCFICGSVFPCKTSCLVHCTRLHAKYKKHKCDLCDKSYFSRPGYHRHLAVAHQMRPTNFFSCDICGKKFNNFSNMRHHIYAHMNYKPYSCIICEREFHARSKLVRHRKSHVQSLKPFVCRTCGRSFRENYTLKRHMKCHRVLRFSYTCAVCNKKYKWKCDLIKHLKMHTNEVLIDQHRCSECGKNFANACSLQAHVSFHNEGKKFACWCGKRYKFNTGLLRHKKNCLA